MGTDERGPSEEATRLLYKEAKHRVAVISEAVSEMDDRIQGVVRFNVLILGLFIPGTSLLLRSGTRLPLERERSLLFLAGAFAAFIFSTIGGVTAYLKRGTVGGIDAESLATVLGYDAEATELQRELVRAYRLAAAEEEAILERTARRFRFSLYTLIVGLFVLLGATTTLWVSGGT